MEVYDTNFHFNKNELIKSIKNIHSFKKKNTHSFKIPTDISAKQANILEWKARKEKNYVILKNYIQKTGKLEKYII